MMLQPFQESLDKTITKIKNNRILLPNFQRDFVWREEDNQKNLVASVLTKMPIGNILLLKAKDPREYSCKSLGSTKILDPNTLVGKGDVEFLLDGQQRLTVLANVFSSVIFELSDSKELIAPAALKRRFFLAFPRYGNVSCHDLFGLHRLVFPLEMPDNDVPDFQTADILDFIRVLKFSPTSSACYNPYYKNSAKLSMLEAYCLNAEPDFYYVPLFLLIDSGKTNLNTTTLSMIIKTIAQNVADAKLAELVALYNDKKDIDIIKDYIKNNLDKDVYDAYFDETCFKKGIDEVLNAYLGILSILVNGWHSNMLLYLKSCISQINLSQISLDDSQKARAIDIYENLNRGGVRLDIFDLLMARVSLANTIPYNTRIIKHINEAAQYPDSLIFPEIKNDFQKIKDYKASVNMVCYDEKKKEFVKNYLDAYLNVMSLLSYRRELSKQPYGIDLIKRPKKLALKPEQLDDNCQLTCDAIDRACYFFQTRCGIRRFKEINYALMIPVVAYILSDDDCYTGSYGEKVFNLLEGWYWISIFSGHFDRDQNARMIVDLNLLVDCVLSIKDNLHPNLVWLKDRQNKVLNMPGYSDLKHILMENSQNEEYPKFILTAAICQYYLSRGYYDLLKDRNGDLKHISVFASDSNRYQIHHVIPLGSHCTVSVSSENIRKDKKHFLNSPLNMLYISDEINNAINSLPLSSYASQIPCGAGLIHVGFSSSDIDINATDSDKKDVLTQRYNNLLHVLTNELTSLLTL